MIRTRLRKLWSDHWLNMAAVTIGIGIGHSVVELIKFLV